MMRIYFWLADKLFYIGTSTSKRELKSHVGQELDTTEPVLLYHSKSKNWVRAIMIIIAFTAMGIGTDYFDWSFTAAGYRINDWWVGSLIGLVIAISPLYKAAVNKSVISMDKHIIKT
jgi:hypothetical protein